MTDQETAELVDKAKQLRRTILTTITRAGSGHVAPAFSCVELITALYFHVLRVDTSRPKWEDRDRFILSAGHKCMAQYVALAERGFFPASLLETYNKYGSMFGGHPDAKKVPGIDASTGSLGHGLGLAVGMGLAAKMDRKSHRVFVLLGDGELNEGTVWEAAMAAAHYKLDNVVAIVDRNGLQGGGSGNVVMSTEPLVDKWVSFGWRVRVVDGHDMKDIIGALDGVPFEAGRPSVVIALTVKGKGVSFMENQASWHLKVPTAAEYEVAMRELA